MKKLTYEQALGLLRLQDKMNTAVNPSWLTAGYPFLRAVVVEIGEAMEHYGWKWWKKQAPNIEQVQIELIDILHFMLSDAILESKGSHKEAAQLIAEQSNPSQEEISLDGNTYLLRTLGTLELLELLSGLAVCRRNSFPVLEACFTSCAMDWDIAIKQYISKNVLNIFRQNHGYKEGTYLKEWDGKEDNYYLVKVMNVLNPESPTFTDDLYSTLEDLYGKEMQRVRSK